MSRHTWVVKTITPAQSCPAKESSTWRREGLGSSGQASQVKSSKSSQVKQVKSSQASQVKSSKSSQVKQVKSSQVKSSQVKQVKSSQASQASQASQGVKARHRGSVKAGWNLAPLAGVSDLCLNTVSLNQVPHHNDQEGTKQMMLTIKLNYLLHYLSSASVVIIKSPKPYQSPEANKQKQTLPSSPQGGEARTTKGYRWGTTT